MRKAASTRLEMMNVRIAFSRSFWNARGGTCVAPVLLKLEKPKTKNNQGTSVQMLPIMVCCIVHGTSVSFLSTNKSSIFPILYYSIGYGVLSAKKPLSYIDEVLGSC